MNCDNENIFESKLTPDKEVESREENKVNTELRVNKSNKLAIMLFIVTFLLVLETILICTMNHTIGELADKISKDIILPIEKADENADEFNSMTDLLSEIDAYYKGAYVGDINYENLDYVMANSLIYLYGDKYGIYRTPEEVIEDQRELHSELTGVGILVRAESEDNEGTYDRLYVIDSYDGSDALEKGLTKGCTIIKVNDEDIKFNEVSYNDVIEKIRGEEGTSVRLTFINKDGEEITQDIERRKLETVSIRYNVINNEIGYIHIRDFVASTDKEFKEVLKYFENRGIDKIIFDLRDNTGGLLDSVVGMLDSLLPEQDIIYTENKNKEICSVYKSDSEEYNFKGVCIINGRSASASELFVKSLQESGKVTVVGEKSYGKGTVCRVIPLQNGGSLNISSYRFLTSSGECLEGVGITPDIEMKLSEEEEAILYKLDISEDDIIIESVKLLSEE